MLRNKSWTRGGCKSGLKASHGLHFTKQDSSLYSGTVLVLLVDAKGSAVVECMTGQRN